jgi:putative nucleotidyltransferase with HDIG domain
MAAIRESILKRLDHENNLPSMNATVRQVQEMVSQGPENWPNSATIGKVIEKDLGLAAKVLKIANSVYFGGRFGPIGDIGHAVSRLGIEEVNRICTSIGCIQMFAGTAGNVDVKDFWKHSLGVAIVMRYFTTHSRVASSCSVNAYIAGLFHDIGILILDRYFTKEYGVVLEAAKQGQSPLFKVERKALGIDHGEIGALLCRKWRLPKEIIEAVTWHHFPDGCREEDQRLCQLVHIANFTCSAFGVPEPGDVTIQTGSAGAWHDLEIDNCDLNAIAGEVKSAIEQGGDFVSLSI